MKTYLLDIIPQIIRFSKKIDRKSILSNKHWVLLNEEKSSKTTYIFRPEMELLISTDGNIERAKWEYLGQNSLIIENSNGSYLFKHGFLDESILTLQKDGKKEYVIFVEESFVLKLNSISNINQFLENRYLKKDDLENGIDQLNKWEYLPPEHSILEERTHFSIMNGHHKEIMIEFSDGSVGPLYQGNKSNKFFLINGIMKMYYVDFNRCIAGLHYLLKNKHFLKEGKLVM